MANKGGRPKGSKAKAVVHRVLAPDGRPMTRVVGYVRVSSEQQATEGVSLDAQRAKLAAHCTALDLNLVALESDEGVSAKTLDRPALQRALAMLREGKADALLIPKLDRLTRRVIDLGLLIEDYFAEGKWALLSVADQIDTRTAAGRMVLFILMTVAQWEREAIGERTRDALAHLRTEGIHLGRAAMGMRHSDDLDAEGRRVIVRVEADIAAVERIRHLRASGSSFAEIAESLASEGYPTQRGGRWLPNTVRRIWMRSDAVEALDAT